MLEGIGKVIKRPTKTAGKTYDKYFIYIPASVAKDSAFPFSPGEKVVVRIEGERVVIEKLRSPE
jgi:hypothetical protein